MSLAGPAPGRDAVLSSVDQVPALSGWLTTGGRLNAGRAMAAILGVPAPPPTPPLPCEYATASAGGVHVQALTEQTASKLSVPPRRTAGAVCMLCAAGTSLLPGR